MSAATKWRITLFGALGATLGERTMARLKTKRTEEVLAKLALHPGRMWSAELLASSVWPEKDLVYARASLKSAISDIQQGFRWSEGMRTHKVVVSERSDPLGQRYGLDAAFVSTDLQEFRLAISAAAAAANRTERNASLLDAAGLHSRGLLLEDFACDDRLAVFTELCGALRGLVEAKVSTRLRARLDSLIGIAAELSARLYETDGHHLEDPYLAKIRFHRQGKNVENERLAIIEFQRRTVIRAVDLRLALSAQTCFSDEARQLIESCADAPPFPPPALQAPGSALPIDRMLTRNWHQPSTRLVGRDDEVKRVCEILADSLNSGTRLVTLTGEGGIGKSTLAVTAAHAMRASFRNRLALVLLADIQEAQVIPAVLAHALGAKIGSAPSLDTVLDALADRIDGARVLIILDNAEHLRDGVAEQVRAYLRALPSATFIVTSRLPLNIEAERRVMVKPLGFDSVKDGQGYESSALRTDSFRLFVERATAADANFALDSAAEADVAELCEAAVGNPLHIELLASQLQHTPLPELVRHVRSGSAVDIHAPADDVPRRRKSMLQCLEISWSLLPQELRPLFVAASVFRSAWPGHAALYVLGEPGGVDRAQELADHSLLALDRVIPVERRYRMRPPYREFARRQVEPAEYAQLQARHADWCRHLLKELSSVPPSLEDVGTALTWALDHGDLEMAAEIAAQAAFHWNAANRIREGVDWCTAILSNDLAKVDKRIVAEVHFQAGRFWGQLGVPDKADDAFETAGAIFRELPPDRFARAGYCFAFLGNGANTRGDNELALAFFSQAADEFQRCGKPKVANGPDLGREKAQALCSKANALMDLGRVSEAQREYLEARRLVEDFSRDNRLEPLAFDIYASTALGLGNIALQRGMHEEAESHYTYAAEQFRCATQPLGIADCYHNLAWIHFCAQDFDAARGKVAISLKTRKGLGEQWQITTDHLLLGRVDWCVGRRKEAVAGIEKALRQSRAGGYKATLCAAVAAMGDCAATLDRRSFALWCWRQAERACAAWKIEIRRAPFELHAQVRTVTLSDGQTLAFDRSDFDFIAETPAAFADELLSVVIGLR